MRSLNKIYSINFWMNTIFIINIAGASSFVDNNIKLLIIFGILGYLFYIYGQKLDMNLIYIFSYWVIVNIISTSFINIHQPFSLTTVFTRLIPIVIIYFVIKLGEKNFFIELNQYAYVLVIITLFFFTVQLALPSVMRGLSGIFSFMTTEAYQEENGWYNFFFRYTDWHAHRNCGFMWEPGGFAGFLIFLISFRLAKNDFQIDKYIAVFFIALLTTQSTAGYLALVFIIAAYFVKNRRVNFFLVLLVPILIITAYFLYYKLEFISGKIGTYQQVGTGSWGMMGEGVKRTTRWGFAIITLNESLHWPFGHGIIEHSMFKLKEYGKIYGPGSLSQILHQWGWPGLLVSIGAIYKFYQRLTSNIISILLSIGLLIVLFSNPTAFLLLLYCILFYLISYPEKEQKQEDKALSLQQ